MQVDARARIETGLAGSAIVVGGTVLGSGAATLGARVRRTGHEQLWRTLEASGSMTSTQFNEHLRHYRLTAELPATVLRRTGATVALGSVLIGGAMVGAALLGGD